AAVLNAARLQQDAAPGATLVGERAAAAARDGFEFGAPGVLGRPLLRALAVTLRRAGGPFVGRTAELETLRAAYRRGVAAGRPGLVTGAGDAGAGKTRPVREPWVALAAEPPAPLRR